MSEPIKRIPYPSDLSDKEWEINEPIIPIPKLIEVESGHIPTAKY
jgi:hypothetical protein